MVFFCKAVLQVSQWSISRDICLFFNFPTPSNTSGYYCFNLLALVVTTATLIANFSTPNWQPSKFDYQDLVDLSQTPIVHLKFPFAGNGRFDAYEYSFLSGEAACESHFSFRLQLFPNNIAVAPESISILRSTPPTWTMLSSEWSPSLILNA